MTIIIENPTIKIEMPSNKFLKILLVIFIVFALIEIIFTIQKYGFPKIDIFKPKAGNCKTLEQRFCDQARKVVLDINGDRIPYMVVNLPYESPFFTPIDGLLVKTKESGTSEVIIGQIRSSSEAGGGAAFRGDLKFENMLQQNVKAGDIIGFVNNTGVKITKDSTFNLAFTITKRTPNGPVVDEEKLKELFPKAF